MVLKRKRFKTTRRRAHKAWTRAPNQHWHEQIGDPTLADAMLDRLIHNAHKIHLKGGSMRKQKADLTQ